MYVIKRPINIGIHIMCLMKVEIVKYNNKVFRKLIMSIFFFK
jgi:hypothetical protein